MGNLFSTVVSMVHKCKKKEKRNKCTITNHCFRGFFWLGQCFQFSFWRKEAHKLEKMEDPKEYYSF